MKNNLKYYRHEIGSHNHWKFKLLRKEYGWEGDGKFWALNNEIAASDNCTLDLNDEGRKMSLAIDLDFDIDDFDKYLLFLSAKCKLITMADGKLSTGITQENLEEANKERERKREWIKNKRDGQNPSTERFDDVPEVSKDDYSNNVDVYTNNLDGNNQQTKTETKTKLNSITTDRESTTPPLLEPDGSAEAEKKLKEVYRQIAGNRESLENFIKNENPQFVEPYAKFWNFFATENGFPKVDTLTDTRRKKIKTRCKEPPFDFLKIMEKVERSDFDRTKKWLSFDWILENQSNYVKILEGNYDKKLINGTHQQTPNGTGGKQAGAVSFLQRGQKIFGAG